MSPNHKELIAYALALHGLATASSFEEKQSILRLYAREHSGFLQSLLNSVWAPPDYLRCAFRRACMLTLKAGELSSIIEHPSNLRN
jgi:hypothetical protein